MPLFAGMVAKEGRAAARLFAEDALAALLTALVVFLVAGEVAAPWLLRVLAPGFADEPGKFALTVALTRITFPYLLFISLVALQGGVLNSVERFAATAVTPTLLNIFLIGALLLVRPVSGAALAWAVTAAGFAQFLWLMVSCAARASPLRLPRPRLSPAVRRLVAADAAGRVRRRRDAAQSGDLDGDRLAAADGRGVLSLLRRPARPASAGRRRLCRRHGDPAAAVAPGAPRRRRRARSRRRIAGSSWPFC